MGKAQVAELFENIRAINQNIQREAAKLEQKPDAKAS